jgi:hypothetical protein
MKSRADYESEQAELVEAYARIPWIVLQDLATAIPAEKSAGAVLARLIQMGR